MGMFDDIARFLASPAGKMMSGIAKDAFNNHIYPYMRENMNNALKPIAQMPKHEQTKQAYSDFVTVDDFDIQNEKEDIKHHVDQIKDTSI